jgi:hypothetical protein
VLPLQIADPVVAPATVGTLTLPWALQADGAAPPRVPVVAVRENLAELAVDGAAHLGTAYLAHFEWAGYDVYDILSVAADGSSLAVTYLYCRGDSLAWVWTLSYAQPLSVSPALTGGGCASARHTQASQVSLPPLLALPPARRSGFTIAGADLHLADAVGGIVITGDLYNVYVLTVIDCSSCPGGPWYEVLCLFRRVGEAGFGILYLYPGSPDRVTLSHVLMLPGLTPRSQSYAAKWSGTPVAAVRGWHVLPGEPLVLLSRPPAPRAAPSPR